MLHLKGAPQCFLIILNAVNKKRVRNFCNCSGNSPVIYKAQNHFFKMMKKKEIQVEDNENFKQTI